MGRSNRKRCPLQEMLYRGKPSVFYGNVHDETRQKCFKPTRRAFPIEQLCANKNKTQLSFKVNLWHWLSINDGIYNRKVIWNETKWSTHIQMYFVLYGWYHVLAEQGVGKDLNMSFMNMIKRLLNNGAVLEFWQLLCNCSSDITLYIATKALFSFNYVFVWNMHLNSTHALIKPD